MGGCSKGVLFQVRLNGQPYFEIFKDTFNWKDGNISLPAFADQPLLLELVTDPGGGPACDWAHWAALFVKTAPNPDLNRDEKINVFYFILIAKKLGQQVPEFSPGDPNGDGVIAILDFTLVSQSMSKALD